MLSCRPKYPSTQLCWHADCSESATELRQRLDGGEDVSPLVRPMTVDVELAERAVPQDLTKRREALSSRSRMAGGSSEVRMSARQSGAAGNGALAPPHA